MGRLKGVMEAVFGGGSKNGKKAKGALAKQSGKSKDPAYNPSATVDSTDVLYQDVGLYGKVFVLSLVEFYDAIGGRDGRIAEGLPVLCETVFEDQLGADGSFTLVGEDQYIFQLPKLDERQQLLKSAKIIEIIGSKLLGENFLKSGKFKALLTAVGMDDLTDDNGNVSKNKVDHAVGMARNLPPEPSAPEDPVWLRLNYAGVDEDDRWAAVTAGNKGDVQWVSLKVEKKNTDLQWTTLEHDKKNLDSASQWETLEHKKEKNEAQWEFTEHKKKDSDFDWQALEVRKEEERRALLMQDGMKRFRDRRQQESDRRMRRTAQFGDMERRAEGRRESADRRAG